MPRPRVPTHIKKLRGTYKKSQSPALIYSGAGGRGQAKPGTACFVAGPAKEPAAGSRDALPRDGRAGRRGSNPATANCCSPTVRRGRPTAPPAGSSTRGSPIRGLPIRRARWRRRG